MWVVKLDNELVVLKVILSAKWLDPNWGLLLVDYLVGYTVEQMVTKQELSLAHHLVLLKAALRAPLKAAKRVVSKGACSVVEMAALWAALWVVW